VCWINKDRAEIKRYPTLGEAYRLKVLFNGLWKMPDKPGSESFSEARE